MTDEERLEVKIPEWVKKLLEKVENDSNSK